MLLSVRIQHGLDGGVGHPFPGMTRAYTPTLHIVAIPSLQSSGPPTMRKEECGIHF